MTLTIPKAMCSCGKHWSGLRTCHCSSCHRTFSGLGLFDAHRRRGHCLDPATISGAEFRDGMWRGPEATDELKAKWKQMTG